MRQLTKRLLGSGICVIAGLMCTPGYAGEADDKFYRYVKIRCETDTEFTSVPRNFVLCQDLFQGSFTVDPKGRDGIVVPGGVSGNSGRDAVKGRLGQLQITGGGGGTVSAGPDDEFGLGLFATDVSAETEREASELENGFESDTDGTLFGIDYRFMDALVAGVAVGSFEDEAVVDGEGAGVETDSDSTLLYATWLPMDGMAMDFYFGSADTKIRSQRQIEVSAVGVIEGTATGETESEQDIYGLSLSYDWYMEAWSAGLFAALDSVETKMDGYSEEGDTGLELRFPDQEMESELTSFGLRASYNAEFGWGSLLPNLKWVSVREGKDDARQVAVGLASAPTTTPSFVVATDDPDRSYNLQSWGLIVAFNNGAQIFVDFEERSGHEFIENKAVTAGVQIVF
jgi:uncharacterized protein YhjY with autotransporter beta-barrel domain